MSESVNLHVERLAELPAAIERVRQLTGVEPVVCVHIYAPSVESLREFFQRGKFRTMPVQQAAFRQNWHGEFTVDDFSEPPFKQESPELIEARAMLAKWLSHTPTAYAVEQRGHWQRRVELLAAAVDGEAAPPDDTPEGA